MPPIRPNFAGAAGAVPTDRSLDLATTPDRVYASLTDALQSLGADITNPHQPSGLLAVIPYKSLGTPLRFRCQAIIQPTPSGSRLAYGIKVDWSSTFVVLGILVAIGVINIMFLSMWVGVLAPLCSIGGIGWAVYDYAVGIPNKLAAQVQKKLASAPSAQPAYSATAPVQPAQPAPAPMPAAAPVTAPVTGPSLVKTPDPAPAPVPASASEDDVIAKIEKLAVLKGKGLISDAEFEQRRTELLDRL
jgi:hypothetical protein